MHNYNKEIDISKLKKKDINNFIEKLIYTNKVVWDAMCSCEEFIENDIIYSFMNEMDDNKRINFLQKIAKLYNEKNKKYDTTMADPESNESDFSDFSSFGKQLQPYLDKIYEEKRKIGKSIKES